MQLLFERVKIVNYKNVVTSQADDIGNEGVLKGDFGADGELAGGDGPLIKNYYFDS